MPATRDEWDLAPCGLLEVDGRRVISRANEQFLARTGYTRPDIERGLAWTALLTPAGRILYETQLAPMLALNGRVEELLIELVCADGRRLPVLVTAEQTTDGGSPNGERTRVALMSVPDRQQYEQQLRAARAQAEQANAANLRVRTRLELLARANASLASSLDVDKALGRLAAVLVGELCDWCLVYAADPDRPGELPHWAAAHVDAGRQQDVERLAPLLPARASAESAVRRVVGGSGPLLLATMSLDDLKRMTTSPEVVELVTTLGLRSALVVPSTAREEGAAALALVRGPDRPPFTSDDLADVADLGERTAIAIDNLRLYARARSISIGLQKALLTPLPTPPGLQLASRYEPGANGSAIGGDWYDAFDQPDGTTVVVVGDVVGHDLDAAAAMGHLRGVIRTIGHTTSATPAQTLRRADRAAVGLQVRAVASAVVAGLREVGPDVFTLQWSCAGHPPPLLVRRTGEVVVLSGTSDVLLGVSAERERRQFEVPMHRGETLVLYTDGLVERRDEGLEDGIARLAEQLAGTAGIPLSELCERAVRGHPPGNDDDLAMLVVRIGSGETG